IVIAGMGIAMAPLLLTMNAAAVAPYVELYLLGDSRALPALLALAGIGFATAIARSLATLQRTRAQAGMPIELTFRDTQMRQQKALDLPAAQQSNLLAGNDRILAN